MDRPAGEGVAQGLVGHARRRDAAPLRLATQRLRPAARCPSSSCTVPCTCHALAVSTHHAPRTRHQAPRTTHHAPWLHTIVASAGEKTFHLFPPAWLESALYIYPHAAPCSKFPPWQCPSSAPAAPQGAPGGSVQLGTSGAEARPLGAPPPGPPPRPQLLERAALLSKGRSPPYASTAFDHGPGARTRSLTSPACPSPRPSAPPAPPPPTPPTAARRARPRCARRCGRETCCTCHRSGLTTPRASGSASRSTSKAPRLDVPRRGGGALTGGGGEAGGALGGGGGGRT